MVGARARRTRTSSAAACARCVRGSGGHGQGRREGRCALEERGEPRLRRDAASARARPSALLQGRVPRAVRARRAQQPCGRMSAAEPAGARAFVAACQHTRGAHTPPRHPTLCAEDTPLPLGACPTCARVSKLALVLDQEGASDEARFRRAIITSPQRNLTLCTSVLSASGAACRAGARARRGGRSFRRAGRRARGGGGAATRGGGASRALGRRAC
jgi:hypothetical protein